MHKITVPPMYDVKVVLDNGATLVLPCDGEYRHDIELYNCNEVEHIYIRAYLEDDWIEITKGLKNGFVHEVPDDGSEAKRIHSYASRPRSMVYPEHSSETVEDADVGTQIVEQTSKETKPDFSDLANVTDEPENLGKDFLKAQLSTKNQMKIRNILAVLSSIAVMIAFLLEKLGII